MKSNFYFEWYSMCARRSSERNKIENTWSNSSHPIQKYIENDFCEMYELMGYIKDYSNHPIPNISLKLMRYCCGKKYMLAETKSNCQGFFQFCLPKVPPNALYRIVI